MNATPATVTAITSSKNAAANTSAGCEAMPARPPGACTAMASTAATVAATYSAPTAIALVRSERTFFMTPPPGTGTPCRAARRTRGRCGTPSTIGRINGGGSAGLVNVTPAIRHRGGRSEEPPRPGTASVLRRLRQFLQLRGCPGVAGGKRQRPLVGRFGLVHLAVLAMGVAQINLRIGGTRIAGRAVLEALERLGHLLLAEQSLAEISQRLLREVASDAELLETAVHLGPGLVEVRRGERLRDLPALEQAAQPLHERVGRHVLGVREHPEAARKPWGAELADLLLQRAVQTHHRWIVVFSHHQDQVALPALVSADERVPRGLERGHGERRAHGHVGVGEIRVAEEGVDGREARARRAVEHPVVRHAVGCGDVRHQLFAEEVQVLVGPSPVLGAVPKRHLLREGVLPAIGVPDPDDDELGHLAELRSVRSPPMRPELK